MSLNTGFLIFERKALFRWSNLKFKIGETQLSASKLLWKTVLQLPTVSTHAQWLDFPSSADSIWPDRSAEACHVRCFDDLIRVNMVYLCKMMSGIYIHWWIHGGARDARPSLSNFFLFTCSFPANFDQIIGCSLPLERIPKMKIVKESSPVLLHWSFFLNVFQKKIMTLKRLEPATQPPLV